MHMKLLSTLLLFLSLNANADVFFENCEPNICESLFELLSQGVPVFASQINTGKSLNLNKDDVVSIKQKGSDFKIEMRNKIKGRTIYHHVSYKCFSEIPCLFVSTGGITSVLVN